MRLTERLSKLKGQYIFVKWSGGNEYGKLADIGNDYIELNVIDINTMDYQETLLLNERLLLEVSFGGWDISRIVAEVSSKIIID